MNLATMEKAKFYYSHQGIHSKASVMRWTEVLLLICIRLTNLMDCIMGWFC